MAARTRTRGGNRGMEVTMQLEDVSVGAEYDGKVTSVREYGAFVSFGANADGLVHISQIADSFVEDISEEVKVGQEVRVRVLSVDLDSKRVGLSMRSESANAGGDAGSYDGDEGEGGEIAAPQRRVHFKRGRGEERAKLKVRVGDKLTGTVSNLADFGAFITIAEGTDALLHRSKIEGDGDWTEQVPPGQEIEVYVAEVNGNKINLSLNDPNEHQETLAEDVDSAQVDHQWNDMMVALKEAGLEVQVPASAEESAEPEPAVVA